MYIQICYKILKRQLLCYGVIHSTEVILHSYKPNYFINQRVIIITKKLSDPILPQPFTDYSFDATDKKIDVSSKPSWNVSSLN